MAPLQASSSQLPSHFPPHTLSLSSHLLRPPSPQATATAMKLIKSIHPKNLLRSKKPNNCHISISDPASFNPASSSSSSSDAYFSARKSRRSATPTSVLPPQTSGDWSDSSITGAVDVCVELVEAFKLIDRDGDGKITARELEVVLSRIGVAPPSEEELATMLAEIDRDGDGCISLEECAAVGAAVEGEWGREELRETFDVFDADGDGRISAEELLRVFAAIGDERCTLDDCRRMIESVDVNGDGFVCFEDFRRMMLPQQERC